MERVTRSEPNTVSERSQSSSPHAPVVALINFRFLETVALLTVLERHAHGPRWLSVSSTCAVSPPSTPSPPRAHWTCKCLPLALSFASQPCRGVPSSLSRVTRPRTGPTSFIALPSPSWPRSSSANYSHKSFVLFFIIFHCRISVECRSFIVMFRRSLSPSSPPPRLRAVPILSHFHKEMAYSFWGGFFGGNPIREIMKTKNYSLEDLLKEDAGQVAPCRPHP